MTNTKLHELELVTAELIKVESDLEELLQRQQELLKRKKILEQRISQPQKNKSTDTKEWERTDFKWSSCVNELKSSVFQLQEFRPLQLQAINATLSGKDSIVVMPTGGGKSLCYQLPAVVSKGITLVISPLVSLMEDQLMNLKKLGVAAAMLSAASSKDDIKEVQDAMVDPRKTDKMRLLYVTPEKLAKSKRFMNRMEKMYELGLLARIAIDEVHCCSQWGHDFRPDYKFLGVLKRQFPNTPILGLTATATSDVIEDVTKMLGIPNALVFRAPLNRPNLFYEVHPKAPSLSSAMDAVSKMVKARFSSQSGIIYCLTQKDTEEVTRELKTRGFRVGCYHGNMDAKQRSRVHMMWTKNEIQMVVATIAFGMGIDKPDVRFVIHHSISKSVENYYQESGRAGRDGESAYCILYFNFTDMFRQSTMVFTEQTGLEKLYAMMHYATDLSTCRRLLLAQHFGETWESKHCQEKCDHCNPNHKASTVTKDVTQYCKDVISLLHHAKSTNQRMTSLKLIEAWSGKGSTALRLSSIIIPKLPRSELERIIVHMLLNGYLKEDFHFTPYSTISYITSGSCANILQSTGHLVEMQLLISEAESSSKEKKLNSTKCNEKSEENESGDAVKCQRNEILSRKITAKRSKTPTGDDYEPSQKKQRKSKSIKGHINGDVLGTSSKSVIVIEDDIDRHH